jgi:AcrR family transcriptional regulator
MARTTGSHGPTTMQAIRAAGLQLIFEHGYEATSLRRLAADVGIQAGSLYNHISTKQHLLFDLIDTHMRLLLQELQTALNGIDSPRDRLKAFIAFHLAYHIERKREVFICYSELRSLEPANYRAIVAQRRAYERQLIEILECGVARGDFVVGDPRVAAFGILAMLTGVCTWFDPGGRLTADRLVAMYTDMVLGGVVRLPDTPVSLEAPR